MDDRKYAFLKSVLGDDGAAALKKAADRLGSLEGAIVPRAIMAWLTVVGRGDFEGPLPGNEDSYIDFSKNEDGTYTGSVAIGSGVFPFHNATVFHLAASVSLALGMEQVESFGDFKDVDLVRLGKSIDLLARAKHVDVELAKAIPGPPHAPTPQGAATPAIPGTKQIDKGPELPAKMKPKKPPTEAKQPKHKIPQARVKMPKPAKPKIPAPPKPAKSFPITEQHAKSECPECGLKLIKNDRFTGCMCFRDDARYITLRKNVADNHLTLSFSREVDDDAIAAILDALGVNHG